MSSHITAVFLITLWAAVQDGLSLPVMKPKEVLASEVPTQRVRNKRCACSSLLDSECYYFCHLDVIWVNTPSKTTVYGLGDTLSRRRRSPGRCTCTNPDDRTCSSFCHRSLEIISPTRSAKIHQLNLHSVMRAVASRSRRVQGSPDSHRDDVSDALREDAR